MVACAHDQCGTKTAHNKCGPAVSTTTTTCVPVAQASTRCVPINEAAGAELQSAPVQQPRDINQQPYPGTSSLNQQRGSQSTSSSTLEGSSGSEPLEAP